MTRIYHVIKNKFMDWYVFFLVMKACRKYWRGKRDAAWNELHLLQKNYPNDVNNVLNIISNLYLIENNFEKCLEFSELAIKKEPNNRIAIKTYKQAKSGLDASLNT